MTIYIYIYAARRRRTLGCIGRQSASLLDTRHALLAICPGFKCASVPSGAWHGRGGYGAAHACRAGCRRGLGLLDFRLREGDRIDRLCNGPSKIPPCGSAGTDEVAMSVLPTFSTVLLCSIAAERAFPDAPQPRRAREQGQKSPKRSSLRHSSGYSCVVLATRVVTGPPYSRLSTVGPLCISSPGLPWRSSSRTVCASRVRIRCASGPSRGGTSGRVATARRRRDGERIARCTAPSCFLVGSAFLDNEFC